jgi:iron complex outermembrane receptor protein
MVNCCILPAEVREKLFLLRYFMMLCYTVINTTVWAQQDIALSTLKGMTIEELMNIEVMSVSKGSLKLVEVASAIQVITREDILRSGATNIPEALRLASNLQVAQLNSTAWIISARGFNTVYANKLLVLIDGRTVYTPLFAGVLWDIQNVVLEDVDRIEVISGPGGALWGANAVNGVINIITKKAKDTRGLYVAEAAGDFLNAFAAIRYGDNIGDKFFYRVYAQHHNRGRTFLPNGDENKDAWRMTQTGFHLEGSPTDKDFFTMQGDVFSGSKENPTDTRAFDGQNILGRWSRALSENSNFILQLYYDRYWRDDPITADELETYDLDFQHRFSLSEKHSMLWGVGYRYVIDKVQNRTTFVGLDPATRRMPLYSGFVQDEISFSNTLKLTIGTKLLDNFFSGFEIQPSARIAWTVQQHHTLWAAVSRAVRAPSRLDVDYRLPMEPQPPTVPSVAGGPEFDSEKLNAFELGYRTQPNENSSFSIATFYNDYNDVYSVEPLPGTLTYQIQNGSEAESWGGEFSGVYQLAAWWRMRGGFTYFGKDLRPKTGRTHDPAYLANDAKHQLMFHSMINLPYNFNVDLIGRYLDYLPATFATKRVPEYFTFDTRIAWEYKFVEISLIGQNLWDHKHAEFQEVQIPRSFYGKLTWRF